MKKMLALLLALMMILLAGCGSDALQEEIDKLNAELDKVSAIRTVHAVHATVDGQNNLEFSGETSVTATAVIPEGQLVDHWELNGQAQPDSATETFTFTAKEDTVVSAHFRTEKKLTTINAEIRFLDAEGNPGGDALTEFVFEKDYANPVTGETCEGGRVSAQITAVIPSGMEVDYWMINGVPYYYDADISGFVVENLDETTTYEVVLKEKEIVYYKVTCNGCNFGGKTSGYVAAGTQITVKGNTNTYGDFYIGGTRIADDKYNVTVTINKDTTITFYAVIN
jgi:hypothetical protein